jgi:hypothetical protein
MDENEGTEQVRTVECCNFNKYLNHVDLQLGSNNDSEQNVKRELLELELAGTTRRALVRE